MVGCYVRIVPRTHHVLLIPGFFGFSNLGQVLYFNAVREVLERELTARGDRVLIRGVRTFPTGSLARRAGRVLEMLGELNSVEAADEIHLVGHSTGGIDARLVASTARGLGRDELRARLRKKLKTVVCISSPHRGTPLANFFSTLYGKKLLYLVTLLVFVGLWRRPIAAAASLIGFGYRVNDLLGLNETMLRQLTHQLLKDFTKEREREVREFLESVLSDVSLMVQLTPEAMEIVDRTLEPWPEVRHVSYGTVAPPPLKAISRIGVRDLLTPLNKILYSTLYTLTAQPEPGLDYASAGRPPEEHLELLTGKRLGFSLTPSSNDGVVPSLSQIHGEFRGFIAADHLDVVGHYLRGPNERKDGADWFGSGARFDVDRFEALWCDVARVLLGEG